MKKEKEYFKKNSSQCQDECPINDNTNPISNPSKYLSNDNNYNGMEFDHLATNNIQLNNNLPVIQYQEPNKISSPSLFNNQNPFINALASKPPEFNNFYSNQNLFMQNPYMHMDNISNPNHNLIGGAYKPAIPIQEENDDMTCKSHQGKPLPKFEIENKENIQNVPIVLNVGDSPTEHELIIQPTEGAQTTFYCIKDSGGKIGRHSSNQMVILEERVSRYHAEILFKNKDFYIRDIGSTTGTFLKITANIYLEIGMIIEMGSNQFIIEKMTSANNAGDLCMVICEGPNVGQRLVVSLKDQLTHNSVGRKNTNTFPFPDDQHLSNIHAKFFILDNKFYLEDLSSTNG